MTEKDQQVGVEIIHISERLGTKITRYTIQKIFGLLLIIHKSFEINTEPLPISINKKKSELL